MTDPIRFPTKQRKTRHQRVRQELRGVARLAVETAGRLLVRKDELDEMDRLASAAELMNAAARTFEASMMALPEVPEVHRGEALGQRVDVMDLHMQIANAEEALKQWDPNALPWARALLVAAQDVVEALR